MAELNYTPCKFNALVGCPESGRSCWRCGWNPEVMTDRLKKFYNPEKEEEK